ncbi:MAG: hypothetical protein DHS20C20_04580 [Ardenticatenaceae bacterium]|nr:MAG: hypothetical protein DHS20C20_04580 [Ardenticatenaceae bacterium]
MNGRSAALTVGGTIFLLILINWGVMWMDRNYPENRGYWLVRQKWELLNQLSEPVDWLILGDSTGNQGLVPEVLTERLGGTAVNLNTVGGMGAVDDAWMLAEYIDRFGPPPQVLIVHTYDVWPRRVAPVFLAKTPLPWGAWQDEYIPSVILDGEEKRDVWLTRYFPLYANNTTLGRAIRRWIYEGTPILQKRFQLQPNGYMPLAAVPESSNIERDLQDHLHRINANAFSLSESNREALNQLVALAETHEIEIFLAFGPLYEKLAADENFQAYYAAERAEIEQITNLSAYVHLLETTAVFPADKMENVDHLIFEAAQIYTGMLSEEIREKRP